MGKEEELDDGKRVSKSREVLELVIMRRKVQHLPFFWNRGLNLAVKKGEGEKRKKSEDHKIA